MCWPKTLVGQHIIVAQAPFEAQFLINPSLSQWGGAEGWGTSAVAEQTTQAEALISQIREALPADRVDILVDYVRGHVRRVLRLDSSTQLERRHKLLDLGFDSLMAVELRGRLGGGLALEQPLPATLVFDYPTIEAIAEYLLRLLDDSPAQSVAPAAESPSQIPTTPSDEGDVAGMTDEEIEALLLKKFGNL
jgi:acyl carrier protein